MAITANQIKKRAKQWLPQPMLQLIHELRTRDHQPSHEAMALQMAFERRQTGCASDDEIALRDDVVLKIDPESREPFEWFCWRSVCMAGEMDAFVAAARGAKSFADVGANHGIFSLVFLALNPDGRVISVDPSSIAGQIRGRNRDLNGMQDRMTLHEVACGAAPGTVRMHANWHHLEVVSTACEDKIGVEVQVETLDALCAREGLAPELLKIDVEGFELEVLKGAEKTLATAKRLFLEVHPELLDELKCPLSAIHEWLTDRGWKIKRLNGGEFTAANFTDQIHTFWTLCEKAG